MEWNITRSERCCTPCEKVFEEGEPFVSALFDQNNELQRRDYCPACWDGLEDRTGVFSFWRTRVAKRDEEKKPLVDETVVMDFFMRLEGTEDEKRLNFRYILALILMRRKQLKFVDIRRRDGLEYLVLKRPRRDAEHEVLNPDLNGEQLAQVQEDLSQMLEADI